VTRPIYKLGPVNTDTITEVPYPELRPDPPTEPRIAAAKEGPCKVCDRTNDRDALKCWYCETSFPVEVKP
jgi:hypothetical protein